MNCIYYHSCMSLLCDLGELMHVLLYLVDKKKRQMGSKNLQAWEFCIT